MDLLDRIGLERPVVQAGMGGGLATAELAAAVSSAGGLGTVGILPPARLAAELRAAVSRSSRRPVAANLIVPFLRRAHVDAVIEARAALVVLSFGFAPAAVSALRDAGIAVLHQVGTVAQAQRALGDGADGLIAQGVEAGGHLVGVEPTRDFLPRALDVSAGRPVLAAGGVHDHATAASSLAAGAVAVVAGTRFLLTEECRAHPKYKERVCGAAETIETTLFGFGWPLHHRVVPNAATRRWLRSGREPAWLRALCRISGALSRVPDTDRLAALLAGQRWVPPMPSPVLAGHPESAVDVGPLYAGVCARYVASVVPAATAVALLDAGERR